MVIAPCSRRAHGGSYSAFEIATSRAGCAPVTLMGERPRVLHVPYTFFPDQAGGTEVYVAGLIEALKPHGFDGAVAAPGESAAASVHSDTAVYRFPAGR